MKMINNLCIISPRYPTDKKPVHTFIDQLVRGLVDCGINCTVISPYSITEWVKKKTYIPKKVRIERTINNNNFKIYSPRYISLSTQVFGIRTSRFTYNLFKKAVIKVINKYNLKPDAFYGHFVYPSGICAADLGKLYNKPSFLAYGECSASEYSHVSREILDKMFKNLSGIISVSNANKKELLDMGLVENSDRVGVFPNAIDHNRFYKIEKDIAREYLNIDKNKFVVIFVGHFIERKGSQILSDALEQLDDVFSIFVGSGPQEPECKNILFKGLVPHDRLYLYLNAADIFVLPTQAEGCCNAIIEAMACGLPIVSSNKPFNDDILNEKNSIRIDENDVEAIKQAIMELKNNKNLRDRLSMGAIISASELNIQKRAERIIEFMNSKL